MGSELNLGTTELLALAAALGWASGMRLYAVVFLTGLAGYLGWVPLPDGLKLLEQPALLWASGIMLAVEFLADKIPVVDSMWDAVHTFIRVPAGAALAAGVFGFDGSQMALVAGLMGGTLAATSHAAKASTRAAVNTSPEPFSNIGLSLLGDAAVPTLLWLAWEHPLGFAVVLGVGVLASVVLLVLTFKFLRALLRRLFGRSAGAEDGADMPMPVRGRLTNETRADRAAEV
ncbi:MAG: DUF4126 domain-containing protein [Burkholderiaceae bacterium]|nr:DUF4126 domain-containing protein [Burkholderiaceae bacterium]